MTLVIDDLVVPLAHFDLQVTATMGARVTAIFGPSGAGKTSLLDAIAGLRPLQRGRITFDDVVLSDLPARARRIGYVPQETALFRIFQSRGTSATADVTTSSMSSRCWRSNICSTAE